MYCTISTRTTETDQRRFAKKAHIKFPTHGLVGNSLLRRFAKLSAWATGNCPCPGFSFTFLCAWVILFFKEELVKDEALFLFSSFVVCVLLLYTPQPTQGSCMYEGQPG